MASQQQQQTGGGFSNVVEAKKVDFEGNRDGTFCLQFSPDGRHLCVGHGNGGVVVYDSNTLKPVCEPKKSRYGAGPTMAIKWNPKDQNCFVCGDSDGNLTVWDIRTKTAFCPPVFEKDNQINAMDFSPDGYYLATAGKDKNIRIYENNISMRFEKMFEGSTNLPADDEDMVYRAPVPCITDNEVGAHHQRIYALKFHPGKENMFLTAGWDDGLKVWDIKANEVRRSIRSDNLPHICGDALDMDADDKILTGSWVGVNALQLWEYTSGELEKNIPFPSDDFMEFKDNNNKTCKSGATKGAFLYCARFADNDCVLAGGSGTNSVLAVNHETGQCLGSVKMTHCVQALDSFNGGRIFAVGGKDRYLKIAHLV